jgi:hypothetical protein
MMTKNIMSKPNKSNKPFIGNYKWLSDTTELYGPVSLYVLTIGFIYNKRKIQMKILLMGDLHTPSRKIKETRKKHKLHNFILNVFRTNSQCFDLFIETFSPHIGIKLENIRPYDHKKRSRKRSNKRNSKRNSKRKSRKRPTSPVKNQLIVGTDASLLRSDTRTYDIPLEAMRDSPLLLYCRYHEQYNKQKQFYYNCRFPNLRYHSWDLRFTKTEHDLSILAEISMTYDVQLYSFAKTNSVSGRQLTQFLMGRPLTRNIDEKIKRMYYRFYGKVLKSLHAGTASDNIKELFSNHNINADYKFKNFDKQRLLIQKQFNKVPINLRKKLVNVFTRVYNTPDTFCLALTDFYTICRMLSKFRHVKNRPTTCHNSEYVFCQNIIYYAGAQHTLLLLDVFVRMFGKKSLRYSTGLEKFHENKSITLSKFRTPSTETSTGYINLKQPTSFLDVMDIFYQ